MEELLFQEAHRWSSRTRRCSRLDRGLPQPTNADDHAVS